MTPHPMKVSNGSDRFVMHDGEDFETSVYAELRKVHARSLKSFKAPNGYSKSLDPHKYVRWCAATLRHLERLGRVEAVTWYNVQLPPSLAEDFGPRGRDFIVKFVP